VYLKTLPPTEDNETLETDEFIFPDQILEAMDFSLQQCTICKSREIQNLELGYIQSLVRPLSITDFKFLIRCQKMI